MFDSGIGIEKKRGNFMEVEMPISTSAVWFAQVMATLRNEPERAQNSPLAVWIGDERSGGQGLAGCSQTFVRVVVPERLHRGFSILGSGMSWRNTLPAGRPAWTKPHWLSDGPTRGGAQGKAEPRIALTSQHGECGRGHRNGVSGISSDQRAPLRVCCGAATPDPLALSRGTADRGSSFSGRE